MGDIASTVNDLVDAHEDHVEENQWIKDKLADLEYQRKKTALYETYTC